MKFLFLFATVLVGCFAADADKTAAAAKDTAKDTAKDAAKAQKTNMKLYRKYMDVSRTSRATSLEAQAQRFSGAKKYKWLGSTTADSDQANLMGKLSSYQGQSIKTDMAYEKWMDVMAKEDAKSRDVYRAREGYRANRHKKNYKMLEVGGDSHEKEGSLASLLAYQMTQINHELQEDAYYFALDAARKDRDNKDLRRAVRKADRKLQSKRNLKNSQLMHVMGNGELGDLLEMQSHQNTQHDLEYAVDKAVDAFRQERTRENRLKLDIAEMTLDSSMSTKSHLFLSAMSNPISQMLKIQASQLKEDIYELKEELAFEAFNTARGGAPMGPARMGPPMMGPPMMGPPMGLRVPPMGLRGPPMGRGIRGPAPMGPYGVQRRGPYGGPFWP